MCRDVKEVFNVSPDVGPTDAVVQHAMTAMNDKLLDANFSLLACGFLNNLRKVEHLRVRVN